MLIMLRSRTPSKLTHRIDGQLCPQDAQRSAAAADRGVRNVSLKPLHSGRQAEHRPPAYQPARTSMSHNSVVMLVPKRLVGGTRRSFRVARRRHAGCGCFGGCWVLWTAARSTAAVTGRR